MRTASISRNTLETQIDLSLNLDGNGLAQIDTGLAFFEHMLNQICRHGLIDLQLKACGDLAVDAHHLVEDIGIVFGQAFSNALADKSGLRRYGHAFVPLDESMSRVVIDLSGRSKLIYNVEFSRALIGNFDVDLISEFFHGFVNHAAVTLHIDNLRGENSHHQAETIFKAFGIALRMALERDSRMLGMVPSTKGTLSI